MTVVTPGTAPEPRDDLLANGAANFTFGTALTIGAVALPLVALAAGYDAAAVGLLTAASAVTQLATRLVLPELLRRFGDRSLILIGFVLLALSYIGLLLSTEAPVFVVVQGLHGTARGLFWTGSQTHAVRGTGGTVRRLAQMQLMGNIGTLVGPALAGALAAIELSFALVAGAVVSGAGALVATQLRWLPPFQRRPAATRGDTLRQPGVLTGSLANFTAGGWRSLLSSYIPVVLATSGYGPAVIGLLLAVTDAAAVAAAALLVPRRTGHPAMPLRAAVVMMGSSLVALPFLTHDPIVAAAALVVGGAGSGLVLVLAPALVSDSVEPEARGEALAVSGTFRAVALMVTPAAVALSLGFMPLGAAMAGAGLLIGAPPLGLAFFTRVARR